MNKKGGKAAMKYYIAKMCDLNTQEMSYTQFGKSGELYIEFPEFREVIDRYNLRSIDVRFENGDRLRIYDIKESRPEAMNVKAACDYRNVALQA
jgi:hypothetical protein